MKDFGRRSTDHGKEDSYIVLARIDENIKTLFSQANDNKIALEIHEAKDDRKFEKISQDVSKGYGILIAFQFFIGSVIAFLAIKFH